MAGNAGKVHQLMQACELDLEDQFEPTLKINYDQCNIILLGTVVKHIFGDSVSALAPIFLSKSEQNVLIQSFNTFLTIQKIWILKEAFQKMRLNCTQLHGKIFPAKSKGKI